MTAALVAIGGAVGACLRFLVDRRIQAHHAGVFPWGTFAVNIAGTLLLGFLTGMSLFGTGAAWLRTLVGTGFCGALTTYSTFGYESVRLFTEGARGYAVANVLATVVAGLGAGLLGIGLAAAIWT